MSWLLLSPIPKVTKDYAFTIGKLIQRLVIEFSQILFQLLIQVRPIFVIYKTIAKDSEYFVIPQLGDSAF